MRKKIYAGIAAIIAVVLLGGIYYSCFFTKTHEYSLRVIGKAISTHDVNKFKKHVDLDTLVSHGLDQFVDFAMKSIKSQADTKGENTGLLDEFGKGLYLAMKTEIVNNTKDNIIVAIETGEWKSIKGDLAEKKKAEELAEITAIRTAKFREISYTQVDGALARVGVMIDVPELKEPFLLVVKMRKLEDGMWQVSDVENLLDYMRAIHAVHEAELKQYIAGIKKIKYENGLKWMRYAKDHPFDYRKTLKNQVDEEYEKALLKILREKYELLKNYPVPSGARALGELIHEYVALGEEIDACYEPGTAKRKKQQGKEIEMKLTKLVERRDEIKKEIEEYLKFDKDRANKLKDELIVGKWQSEDGTILEIDSTYFRKKEKYWITDFYEDDHNINFKIELYRQLFQRNIVFDKGNRNEMILVNHSRQTETKYKRV